MKTKTLPTRHGPMHLGLMQPSTPGPYPTCLLLPRLGATYQHETHQWAMWLQTMGWQSWLFEPLGFGLNAHSNPVVDPEVQYQCLLDILSHIEQDPLMQRGTLMLWGISLGGAVAMLAARHHSCHLLLHYPMIDGWHGLTKHLSLKAQNTWQRLCQRYPKRLIRVTDPDPKQALINDPEAWSFYQQGPLPAKIQLQSWQAIAACQAMPYAASLQAKKVLMLCADNDQICCAKQQQSCFLQIKCQEKRCVVLQGGHFSQHKQTIKKEVVPFLAACRLQ